MLADDSLPPIPECVYSALGAVPVLLKPDLVTSDGETAFGLWLPETRTIELRVGLHPAALWQALLHERVHQILWDAGAMPRDDEEEERICDAIATALVSDMLRGKR